jgi:hypothetical protein
VLPGAALFLLPKCPLCIAAWVAAGTGIALPMAVAGSVRPVLGIACVISAGLVARSAIARFRAAEGQRVGGGAPARAA